MEELQAVHYQWVLSAIDAKQCTSTQEAMIKATMLTWAAENFNKAQTPAKKPAGKKK